MINTSKIRSQKNQMQRQEKGITLIALVITVIVLLILAGTAISISVNGGDLFGKTADARNSWNRAVENEQSTVQGILGYLAEYSGADMQVVSENNNGLTIVTATISDDAGTYKKVTVGAEGLGVDSTTNLETSFLASIDGGYTDWANFLQGYNSFLQGQSKTKDEFIEILKERTSTTTYDNALVTWLTQKGRSTTEPLQVSVKQNGNTVALTNNSFLVTENKTTYEITASTESGKSGSKTITVLGISKETFATPSSVDYNNGGYARIPAGYYVGTSSSINNVANGLVITSYIDANGYSTGDEYVWIPADVNDMIMCKSNASGSICTIVQDETTGELTCTKHNKTAKTDFCGRLYGVDSTTYSSINGKNVYSTNMSFTDTTKASQTFTQNSGYREPDIVTGNNSGTGTNYDGNSTNLATAGMASGSQTASAFLIQLQDDFYEMAKSVAKYGGFWISRYEIGQNGASKKMQTVRSAATDSANMWYGLYKECKSSDTTNKIAKTMIWGSQYDQVINFIGNRAQTGHTDIGLETTACISGFAPLDKMKNIYDLEGNLREWTAQTNDTDLRVYRGGHYSYVGNGNFYPASFRSNSFPNGTSAYFGSRSTLYVTL